MRRKIFAAAIVFTLCAAVAVPGNCFRVLAEGENQTSESVPDYEALSGVWKSEDTEETLTLTVDGLFVYHTEEAGDIQGYLEYVDEYNDGNGRYDMYNRVGVWLAGFYLDSADSLHMGNGEEAVFTRAADEQGEKTDENANADSQATEDTGDEKSYVLMSSKRYTGLRPLYNNSSWEGGYFYSDMTEDSMTVIVNCSALNDNEFTGTPEEYMEQFVSLVCEYDMKDFTAVQNPEYTEKFTYPAYELEFTTGTNEDTRKWKMLYFQTDTHTFAYAYEVAADFAEEMEEEYRDAISSLELTELTEEENTGNSADQAVDYDPSADGKSLEMFIAYFDNWYQYGDLNAMCIQLSGEGTWAIYNSRNADGTGGYLFDSGTFVTLGTTALKLVNDSGSYVADVTLDGNGELVISPVISGYGSIYAGAAFSRESDSVAYEAQPTDDGAGDYIPEEEGRGDYIPDEEEGRGDYIPDEDYVEESDPGDTYYWYDGEGNVMYFDGSDSYYIGPDNVFYIDDAGRLCEY